MLAYNAMLFARQVHANQVRKYTGNPYADHLAEVVAISMSVVPTVDAQVYMAVGWLHDCVEDQEVCSRYLDTHFGPAVACGVVAMSDMEKGTRAQRKAAARERLSRAPGYVQSIKCADVISNTGSIVKHDPKFAKLYVRECSALLDVLTNADPRLLDLAKSVVRRNT